MLLLGLVLVAAGALVIVAAVFTASGTVELLGTDLSALTVFLVGLGAGLAVVWGFTIFRLGTKRSLRHRRESKRLQELSQQLDEVERERRGRSDDPDDDRPRL